MSLIQRIALILTVTAVPSRGRGFTFNISILFSELSSKSLTYPRHFAKNSVTLWLILIYT